MRVLVVEDDLPLAMFLKKGLQLEGLEVECADDGEIALEQAALHRPDLLVLDLGLPRRDGVEVLEAMSERFGEMAVLVLTGRSQVEERVRCLNAGADDYLQKPFSFHEFLARCRAILRRRGKAQRPVLTFGDVRMNLVERSVMCAGVPVELTGKEFLVLESLLRRRGACCSRAELLAEVWAGAPDMGTNVVDVYVNYLRRKFAAAQGERALQPVIETVRGSGYRIRSRAAP